MTTPKNPAPPRPANPTKSLRSPSSQSLTKTLSQIDPKDLDKAWEKVEEETRKRELEASEYEVAQMGNIKATAESFMGGMDKVTDVLLLLVLKFGRATTMLVVVMIGIAVAIVVLVWGIVLTYGLRIENEEMLMAVEKVQRQQNEIVEKADAAEKKAEAARKEAQEATASAPKVVVDEETGSAKLVVKGEDKPSIPTSKPIQPRPAWKPKPKPKVVTSGDKKTVEIPIEF